MLLNSNVLKPAKSRCTKRFRLCILVLPILSILAVSLTFAQLVHGAPPQFNFLDARERGTFEDGSAPLDRAAVGRLEQRYRTVGSVIPTYDSTSNQDVLEFDYSIPPGSTAGVWMKQFPPELGKATVNTVQIGVKVLSPEQVSQISVALEIKGSRDVEIIPLRLKLGWNSFEQPIDWDAIGDLDQVRFVVVPIGNAESVGGTLSFTLGFVESAVPTPSPFTLSPQGGEGRGEGEKLDSPSAEPAPKSVTETKPAEPTKSTFTLWDARERTSFKTGSARGNVIPTFDEGVGKDVLELDYSVPKGSQAGLRANGFPASLRADAVNAVRLGLRVLDANQLNRASIQLEIEGTQGAQTLPLDLRVGWNSREEPLDWKQIGILSEVRLVISQTGDVQPTDGTLYLALDFVRSTFPPNIHPKTGAQAFHLLDARKKGVFNIGASQGNVTVTFDEARGRDIFEFDYTVPSATHVGIWTQEFPEELNARSADALNIGVNVPSTSQLNEISVKAEIKGNRATQTIPLDLASGWNRNRESIHWNLIGNLKEVVFVVSPIGSVNAEPAVGKLYFDLDFGQLTFLEKYVTFVKIGWVLALGLLLALVSFLAGQLSGRPATSPSGRRPVAGFPLQDVANGALAVLIAGLALWIYALGTQKPLEAGFGFSFLWIAVGGTLAAELASLHGTGKHLTPSQWFQNVLVSGLLAASSSKEELWQAPATWMEVLAVSNVTATFAFLIYHISNARSLVSSGKHVKAITACWIVGTPYLFGWLLLLQNTNLLYSLANGISGGLLIAWPVVLEVMGRFLIVFGFNEVAANGIGLATKSKLLKTLKAHVFIACISLGVVVAPLIADAGSTQAVARLPVLIQAIVAIITTMCSYAGLWGEVYLITGIALDAGARRAPSWETISKHVSSGIKKGMAYAGILVALLYALHLILRTPLSQTLMASLPIPVGLLAGALIFPLLKTIIETFDGSLPFFDRVRYSYRNVWLCARGAVAGFGFAYMTLQGMFGREMPDRILFGLLIGLLASSGVSILRDVTYAARGHGRVQSWKRYLVDAFLGAFVGSAAAFYLDSRQIPVVVEKFKLYTSSGFSAVDYVTYPLVNKWGRIDLGTYSGGAKLLFTESLAGVINWSIAAWLFAINKVFMQAYFEKHTAPIKFFFSKEGFAQLVEHMIFVLRWGLWMSPIIFTFLRMMPEPTWYNQDGAIRTLFAIYHNATMSPEAFQAWSLQAFIYVLAFDFFRILIWMDHMGLRVATLVNLSFIGLDRLDERIARFIGSSAAQRCIPEGVKRFATWGPLLIPFYIPRGKEWDYAWNTSEAIQNAGSKGGIMPALRSLTLPEALMWIGIAVLVGTGFSFVLRSLARRARKQRLARYELANREYRVILKENGEVYSEVDHQKMGVFPPEYDVTRRSYDLIDPAGRILYLVDTQQGEKSEKRFWPVVGNFPPELFAPSQTQSEGDTLKIVNQAGGIQTTVQIRLPDPDTTAELWTVTLKNLTNERRSLMVVPYLEWVLNGGLHDRFHTQYARLFPEMEYASQANAILAWHKGTKSMGILAVDEPPSGILSSRIDFIGRARSIWKPRILETLNFRAARDTEPYPTFDPIGSVLLNADIGANAEKSIRLLIGYAKNKASALALIEKHLKPNSVKTAVPGPSKKSAPLIGHGEIPPGTPQPYSEFSEDGNTLFVRTPYTPRPYDHAMSNAAGHSVMVTNRGLHTSSNGNSQQNRLTPDAPDTVTNEIPSEAIYLYDPETKEWYSPTHHPLGDPRAKNESEFSVDGTAVFRMTRDSIATELVVFVPPDDPAGVYLLTVKNKSDRVKQIRVAPYFQMVLEFQPERSGTLQIRCDQKLNALFFKNPRNMFRSGWAFASMSTPFELIETRRGKFFGTGRWVRRPFFVEKSKPDKTEQRDQRQIAAFLGTLQIPAHGESTIAVVLGQTDTRKQAVELVRKYKKIDSVRQGLGATQNWWLDLMGTLEVKTNQPAFDRLQNWLKYQALAERVWARRGFYQTSGAYGFRDQLQDTVNLIWVDPSFARRQIKLHASQQFLEGDVFHWFFTRTDGRTAFSCRSHASDNPLWLAWAVVEYIRATGDNSILDEMTSYVTSEFPFADLPKNKSGWGHLYHRTTREDSVYRHCLKSIDLVLEKRTGKHGLPLIRTGDWNDGLDEIGSEGKGESVWLGFFLYCILKDMVRLIEQKEGGVCKKHYLEKMKKLQAALEATWREDRYLRAFHDDGTEIGVKDSGIWEIDALTAAWAVMADINRERSRTVFDTALRVLERENTVLLGWPALREDSTPYLGRSSKYPEGVRENGMYCHGVQWLIKAARILAEQYEREGNRGKAGEYRETAYRLWLKITPVSHVGPNQIEIYGGQPNKQPADLLTTFEPGRMIWSGYTGAAAWLLRQSFEGVVGASLSDGKLILPSDLPNLRGDLKITGVSRTPLGEKRLPPDAVRRETLTASTT